MKRMGLARSLVLKEALYSIGGAKHTQIKEGKPWPPDAGVGLVVPHFLLLGVTRSEKMLSVRYEDFSQDGRYLPNASHGQISAEEHSPIDSLCIQHESDMTMPIPAQPEPRPLIAQDAMRMVHLSHRSLERKEWPG